MSAAAYFATAPNWVATSSSGSFAVALDYARQRAKLYGRAEVWRFTAGRFESGPASLVLTVYRGWGSGLATFPATPTWACSCTGEHVAACRGWAT